MISSFTQPFCQTILQVYDLKCRSAVFSISDHFCFITKGFISLNNSLPIDIYDEWVFSFIVTIILF